MFATRTFRLKSPLPETSLFFRKLTGNETLGVIAGYDLIALSPSANLPLDQLVGHPVTIEIDLPKGGVRYVHQYVSHMALTGEEGQYYRYEAELRPWLWFLTRTADWKVFQKLNTLDIVKQVFADHGIARFEDRTTQSYPPRRYCVQAGETDASFVMRLLEQEGIYFYFEHSAGAHTLILCDNLAAHHPRGGYATLPFEHGGLDGGMHIDQEHFAWWRCGKTVDSGRVIVNDYDYFRPSADLKVNIADSRPHGESHHDVYLWHSEYYDEGRGRHFAEMRLQAADAVYQTALGSGPIHGLGSGLLFSLIDHPRGDQNREYLIVSEQLNLEENKYETTGSGQGTLEAHLQVLPSSTAYRPPRHTPKPYLAGVQTAVVVGPPGEEIWCDEKGRVKVQFHWDRYGPKTDQSSCWIRVSSQWAGQGFGQTSIPRIGQEVLVQYIEGDPDRPVIIGRVYNDERRTPFGEVMTKTQSGLYSRSSPGGGPSNANIFRFEDKMGEEEVWLHAEKDQRIEVEHDESHWVGNDRTKTIDHDETSHIKHDRTETVDNNETITIHANRTETVNKNEKISIGDNRSEDVGKNETISIGGNRSEDVGQNETIDIGKNRKKSIGQNETDTIGDNWSITVGSNKTECIGLNSMQTIGMTNVINVGMIMNTLVGVQQSEQIGQNKTITVGSHFETSVGKVKKIDVGDHFEICCGSAKIVLTSDGGIYLQGTHIEINGGKAINADAAMVKINTASSKTPPEAGAAANGEGGSENGTGSTSATGGGIPSGANSFLPASGGGESGALGGALTSALGGGLAQAGASASGLGGLAAAAGQVMGAVQQVQGLAGAVQSLGSGGAASVAGAAGLAGGLAGALGSPSTGASTSLMKTTL